MVLLPSLASVRSRARQGFAAIRPSAAASCDEIAARALTPDQFAAFRSLPPFDRSHLCRVHDLLRSRGETDSDVLTASLLHDLGKMDGDRRVCLIHRVVSVLLEPIAPRFLDRLARLPATRWRTGFALAVHHPAIGAGRAAALGCSERACWLIAHHEDDPPPGDAALRRLIAADRAS
jgi:hypothetical protein